MQERNIATRDTCTRARGFQEHFFLGKCLCILTFFVLHVVTCRWHRMQNNAGERASLSTGPVLMGSPQTGILQYLVVLHPHRHHIHQALHPHHHLHHHVANSTITIAWKPPHPSLPSITKHQPPPSPHRHTHTKIFLVSLPDSFLAFPVVLPPSSRRLLHGAAFHLSGDGFAFFFVEKQRLTKQLYQETSLCNNEGSHKPGGGEGRRQDLI